jgi:peptide chain release factor 1
MQQLKGKLDQLERRYDELSAEMANPALAQDPDRYRKTAKAASEIDEVVEKYRAWKARESELESARQMLADSDAEMVELAKQEASRLQEEMASIEAEIQVLLLPRDPNDEKGIVLEVRAGTGGTEAALFAAEIFRMYTRFAESQRWKVEIISSSESEGGGFKEVIALVTGNRVYSKLKYESGVHRVQRVPQTEAQGRIHTSAVTVAVLPQVDEVDVQIDPKDIRIDTFCSSGPGGQSVNTTYSAVRVTHLPTNLVVSCQDEKSQIKNKAKALQVLRSRLYELEREKQHAKQAEERRSMVRSGDRSEKIRTYNFPQNRVTDHRVGLTLHQLDQIIEGRLDPLIDPLTAQFQAELMKQGLDAACRLGTLPATFACGFCNLPFALVPAFLSEGKRQSAKGKRQSFHLRGPPKRRCSPAAGPCLGAPAHRRSLALPHSGMRPGVPLRPRQREAHGRPMGSLDEQRRIPCGRHADAVHHRASGVLRAAVSGYSGRADPAPGNRAAGRADPGAGLPRRPDSGHRHGLRRHRHRVKEASSGGAGFRLRHIGASPMHSPGKRPRS